MYVQYFEVKIAMICILQYQTYINDYPIEL